MDVLFPRLLELRKIVSPLIPFRFLVLFWPWLRPFHDGSRWGVVSAALVHLFLL